MPRLLVITGELPVPSETFVIGHIRGMRDRGWEVAVAGYTIHRDKLAEVFGENPPEVFELDKRAEQLRRVNRVGRWWAMRKIFGKSVDALFHPDAGKRQRSRAAALMEVCEGFKPDVIHAHFGPYGLVAAPACKKLDIPLVINFRGWDFLKYPRQAGWEAYSYFPEDAVAVGHTEFCENILMDHLKNHVEHVRRGVDRERFNPPRRSDNWGKTVKLIVVGRLVFNKGFHLAIDALPLLWRMRPGTRFELTLAGGGELERSLTARARLLGVADSLTFTGALSHDQVGKQMRDADIQLIPSLPRADGWVENFCTVASEGLASGLCVVAANNGGIPEAVHGAGVLVTPGSAFELARGIVHAMETRSPAAWSELALNKAGEYRVKDMMDDYERVTRSTMEAARG